jgi:hypothetical protein
MSKDGMSDDKQERNRQDLEPLRPGWPGGPYVPVSGPIWPPEDEGDEDE